MSDDLSAFFAKKKDKKKKNVVKMDDVGQILERKVKRQEEHDQMQAEADKRIIDDDYIKRIGGEESEWIEYGDSNQGRSVLEGLKIKDMGAESEVPEEEHNEGEEQKEQHEPVKTWGQVEKKPENDHQNDNDFATFKSTKPTYVVPAARNAIRASGIKVDLTNNEMFPSLADASKIEKDKKEEAKTGGGWVRSGTASGGGSSENRPLPTAGRGWGSGASATIPVNSGRDGAIAAVKALTAQTAQNTAVPVGREKEAEIKKSSNVYRPPHIRNRI
uniref:Protein CDV3 homolog n=1 Tax=Heterorhabditis bacteriophora TaxID=37862 RepID=A0A1I7XGA3_HETBA